jgi:two-component system sensor histidine kinase KdpD
MANLAGSLPGRGTLIGGKALTTTAATWVRRILRYVAALGIVGVAWLVCQGLESLTHQTRGSMVMVAAVLVAAYALGSGPGYFAAAGAFYVYNFYLSNPRFSFETASPGDVLLLFVFLGVATLTGNLTGRVRDQAARAQARARATSILFDATQEFAAASDEAFIRQRLAHHLARAARGEAVVRDGQRLFSAPADGPPDETASLAVDGDWSLWPLVADQVRLGEAAWRTAGPEPMARDEQTLVEILADAGAAAIARARLAAEKAEAEARARTEDLRNALLSSISHDLRTPLAAILASASSLHEFGDSFDPGVRADLAATIQEEAVRLDAFVANLLHMTRLEGGAVTIERTGFCIAEVLQRLIERRVRTQPRTVAVCLAPDLPEALGDAGLFEQALGNVIDNALKYTPAAAGIAVTARRTPDGVAVEVADEGPGVPPEDIERIFQKFYRSAAGRGKAGTGLGLSIAKGLMEAMGGTVAAENRRDARSGLAVTLTLAEVAA